MNQDGNLDILYTGPVNCCGLTSTNVLINQNNTPNTRPSPPTQLQDSVSLENAFLFWNDGIDGETPGPGLSYNLKVVDADGQIIVNSLSNDERSSVPSLGKIGNTVRRVHFNTPGTYNWSVQAVDNGHRVSEFSTSRSVELVSQLYFTSDPLEAQAGRNVLVEWDNAFVDRIGLSVSNGMGTTELGTISDQSAYTWEIPFDFSKGNYHLIIRDLESDLRDSLEITINPGLAFIDGDSTLSSQIGRNLNLNWESGDINQILLEYSKLGSSQWNTVDENVPNQNQYAWTIPSIDAGTYKLRIQDKTSNASDTTTLQINPYLEFVEVEGSLTSQINREFTVRWNSEEIDSVVLAYSKSNPIEWNVITDNEPNENQYSWPIPVVDPGPYLLRVQDQSSDSEDTTTIQLHPFLDLKTPTVENDYFAESPLLISWEAFETTSIQVSYQQLGSSTWVSIDTVTSAELSWIPMEELSEDSVRIEIIDLSSNVRDTSEFVFIDGVILSLEGSNKSLKIYPNPVQQHLKLQGIAERSIRTVLLYDLKGIKYQFRSLEHLNSNLHQLPDGHYTIQLEAKGVVYQQNVVILKKQ